MEQYTCQSNSSMTFCKSALLHFKNITGRHTYRQDLKPKEL